ncbi:uncharacterized protein JN550_004975 [Neoarthrinium moseri]|uniref:uncharacterized protein n=1 Tax=Neoarthrinium moseri TaxID=1658444 RepID=UPI001FDDBDEE|nr:uncharacterized protein JN550_004975 [Neoarthrinium moseri]KAI1870829.1 hypothetical protein JN550_004975 [Neoarthrinium moseri]
MLLRRKSGDLGKGGRKQREQELQRQREAVPKSPPRLPALYNGAQPPELQSFGGDVRPDSLAIVSGQAHHQQYQPPNPPSASRQSMDPGHPSVSSNPPMPPIPNGAWADPYARTESMTHRGRYSYASSAISTINSPRRVRRRKDPTPFNILIMGTSGSGKTSFLEFLKKALALPEKKRSQRANEIGEEVTMKPSGNFIPHYLESEIDGERVGLTLWDSEGLEKNVVDLQLREMSAFLESKFEETFAEEMKVIRSPGVQDTHIHAVLLILDPARLDRNIAAAKRAATTSYNGKHQSTPHFIGGLDDDLDLQVMRTLQGKTTVIPVISKADTITTKHMTALKKTVWATLKKANFDPLEPLGLDEDDDSRIDEDDEDASDQGDEDAAEDSADGDNLPIQGQSSPQSKRRSTNSARRVKQPGEEDGDELPLLPMSIISPDLYEPEIIGRQFPWGFANPLDETHCDFTRLKDAVFSEWRGDLREASREQWYEGWRTSRLKHREPTGRRR